MPRRTKSVPRYRKHSHSSQAVVALDGHDLYLGPHGSKTSLREHHRLIAKWPAGGRRLQHDEADETRTVSEVATPYWKHTQRYDRKNGKPTSEVDEIRLALRPVRRLYGRNSAAAFGPRALKAARQTMVDVPASPRQGMCSVMAGGISPDAADATFSMGARETRSLPGQAAPAQTRRWV